MLSREPDPTATLCSFGGCIMPARAKNLCWGHYQQLRRGQALKPLRPRKKDSLGLRVVSHVRESGFDTTVIAGEAKMEFGEVIDWMVTRKPTGADGLKVARTATNGTALRAYWFDSYLAYASPEEFAVASRLIEEAILGKYDQVPPPLYFQSATITKSMEEDDATQAARTDAG